MACLFLLLLSACAWSQKAPEWVTGSKASAYPDDQYMIGVGQGDTRPLAEERAYAALARIFRADITSQAKDWESYLSLERTGTIQTERKLTVETVTKVSTDKVLENVKVAETWHDPKTNLFSALAVLDRAGARAALSSRIAQLDEAIERNVSESRSDADKFSTLRQLHRAIRNLITREALNNDLRVISGRAISTPFSVAALTLDFQNFVQQHIIVAVEVQGDQAEAVRQTIVETLIREGLPVAAGLSGAETPSAPPDLLITGAIRLWPADLPDPMFRYVRWCGDFVMLSPDSLRILGSVGRAGREGHINYREASNRALAVLKQEISAALVKTFAEQIYGDGASDSSPLLSACPRLQGS